MTCPNCQVEVMLAAVTCPRCGALLTAVDSVLEPVSDAAAAATAVTPPGLEPGVRFGRLAGALVGIAAFVAAWLVGWVLSGLAGLLTTVPAESWFTQVVRSPFNLPGLALGSPLYIGEDSLRSSFAAPLPVALAAALAIVGLWSYRSERILPSASGVTLLGRAALPAAITSTLTMVSSFIGGQFFLDPIDGSPAGPDPLVSFLAAFSWIGAAALLGRWLVVGSPKPGAGRRSLERRSLIRGAMRSALTHVVLSCGVGWVVLTLALLMDPIARAPEALTVAMWSLPMGGAIVMEFMSGVPLRRPIPGESIRALGEAELTFVWTDRWWWPLLVLIPVFVLLVVAVRHAAMRVSPRRVDRRDCLLTGGLFAGCYLPINFYLQVDGAAAVGVSAFTYGTGIQQGRAFVAMFVAGALVPVLAAYLAPHLKGGAWQRAVSVYAGPALPLVRSASSPKGPTPGPTA